MSSGEAWARMLRQPVMLLVLTASISCCTEERCALVRVGWSNGGECMFGEGWKRKA